MENTPAQKHPRLLAIVSVPPQKRVVCQQPGCGHGVYAAIHVTEDSGQFLVLGSTCFAKRYTGLKGAPELSGTGWGNGEPLTDQQREMLAINTQELMAQFRERKDEEVHQAQQLAAARLRQIEESAARHLELVRQGQLQRHTQRIQLMENHAAIQAGYEPRDMSPMRVSASNRRPWPWQHQRNTSVAVICSPHGQHWVRVQAADGSQKLVPWPTLMVGIPPSPPLAEPQTQVSKPIALPTSLPHCRRFEAWAIAPLRWVHGQK